MTMLRFVKMVGTGNDFVVLEAPRASRRRGRAPSPRWRALARRMCDRHRGIGADGLLVIGPSRRATARMSIFNADGSEAEMCGNGARCVARLVHRRLSRRGEPVTLETRGGLLEAAVEGDRVRMRMPEPRGLRLGLRLRALGRTFRADFVNTGVPHLVIEVPALERADVAQLGRALRRHPAFSPAGTNVNFIEPASPRSTHFRIRTYERGVEAETLACGTGVTAAAVMRAVRLSGGRGGPMRLRARTRSGEQLVVTVDMGPSPGSPAVRAAVLEGPARIVFRGEFPVSGFPARRNGANVTGRAGRTARPDLGRTRR
ncbi:MAG TPA: diaminopimelate epimerase [bacterium]